jgi:hypothetical protein
VAATRAYAEATDDEVADIERAAGQVAAPTLVLRRPRSVLSPDPSNDPVLAMVSGAVRVDLPGEDGLIFGGEVDALLAEVTRFVTGERANALGGERWKGLLDRHDGLARSCVGRRGGTVIKTTGDGILAAPIGKHRHPGGAGAARHAERRRSRGAGRHPRR